MIFFPAIDLKDGDCVRLLRGEMSAATVYNRDPAAQAKIFEEAGCKWLHVVDLNGAFEGQAINEGAVVSILNATKLNVQLGGGIRSGQDVERWLERGVARVILGTLALREPETVKDVCRKFPGRVAIAIDARSGFVAVEGWAEQSDIRAGDLARAYQNSGAAAIIYTDIDRDGAMEGPNTADTLTLARDITIPVVLSGGVSSELDLISIAASGNLLEGVISGRAIYDGRIDPARAVTILAGKTDA